MTNTTSWILWMIMTMAFLLTTRQPIYLLITLFSLLILGSVIAKKNQGSFWLLQNLRFLLTMLLLSTLINTLFTHAGETVLFKIPEGWILIGGAITAESLVYGATNGLIIGSLYLAFNIINLVLSIKQLTRLIPPAFHPIAIMVTIALTFFPSMQQRAREIKEAQLIRGNSMKKISDWVPLMLPLLVTSLENAFLLAESMTARGFHTQKSSVFTSLTLIGSIAATFTVFAGWIFRLYGYPDVLSIILYIVGMKTLILAIFLSGRHQKVTHFHQENWSTRDILGTSFFAMIIAGFLFLELTNQMPSLDYSPYPSLSWPPLRFIGFILSITPLTPLFFATHD